MVLVQNMMVLNPGVWSDAVTHPVWELVVQNTLKIFLLTNRWFFLISPFVYNDQRKAQSVSYRPSSETESL